MTEEVEKLLAEGADVEEKGGPFEGTALHDACFLSISTGDGLVAQLLLDHNADVSAKDMDGATPLHNAAVRGHVLVAGLLLAQGADVSVKDRFRNTPRELATLHSHNQIASMIEAEEGRQGRRVAFAMGLKERLGAQSCVHTLDADMLRLVLEHV